MSLVTSSGNTVIVVSAIFCALAAFFVSTRLYTRLAILKNAGKDDICIFVSQLSSIALLVSTILEVTHGLGQHLALIPVEDFEVVLKSLWFAIIFYNISLTLNKSAIVLQYLRIFPGSMTRRACWVTIAVILAYGISGVVSGIWTCVPVRAFWTGEAGAYCVNKKYLWLFNAAFNIFTDIVVLLIPMPVLKSLKLPLKQKIGLVFIFALGGFVSIISIIRLDGLIKTANSTDITFDNAGSALWSAVEVNVGIICASLPTIKPLVSRIFPRLLSTGNSTGPPTGYAINANTRSHHSKFNVLSERSNRDDGFPTTGLPMNDLESGKVATKVEGTRGFRGSKKLDFGMERINGRTSEDIGKDIMVTTEMTQDIESKSEIGSEKDLIS